jgi:hypothetical protein
MHARSTVHLPVEKYVASLMARTAMPRSRLAMAASCRDAARHARVSAAEKSVGEMASLPLPRAALLPWLAAAPATAWSRSSFSCGLSKEGKEGGGSLAWGGWSPATA